MNYEWDEVKRRSNLARHGFDFKQASAFDWETAIEVRDTRQDYDEDRFIAYGMFGSRLTVLVYTVRKTLVRIISWRKANEREVRYYDSQL